MQQNFEQANQKIKSAAKFIQDAIQDKLGSKHNRKPFYAFSMGSGYSFLTSLLDLKFLCDYRDIPFWKSPTVDGHDGKIFYLEHGGKFSLFLMGRIHYYEGHHISEIIFPVYVLHRLGSQRLILFNAAGLINLDHKHKHWMVLQNHINFMGVNPLRESLWLKEQSPFIDMSFPYSRELCDLAISTFEKRDIKYFEGIYVAVSGPSYETAAEIELFRTWGVDAVGMSTVPEVIAARHCTMECLALSNLSNPAAGMDAGQLSHAKVLTAVESSKDEIEAFFKEFLS